MDAGMMVTFTSVIDSVSEDNVVVFVDKPGGYQMPDGPEDVIACVREAFATVKPVEVTYDNKSREIYDAKPG